MSCVYKYLIRKSEYQTPDSRKALVRRIREALVKNVSIVGVAKPIEAVMALDAVEDPIDKDYSSSRYAPPIGCSMRRERMSALMDKLYIGTIGKLVPRTAPGDLRGLASCTSRI